MNPNLKTYRRMGKHYCIIMEKLFKFGYHLIWTSEVSEKEICERCKGPASCPLLNVIQHLMYVTMIPCNCTTIETHNFVSSWNPPGTILLPNAIARRCFQLFKTVDATFLLILLFCSPFFFLDQTKIIVLLIGFGSFVGIASAMPIFSIFSPALWRFWYHGHAEVRPNHKFSC